MVPSRHSGPFRYPLGEEIFSARDAELFRAMMRAGIIRKLCPTGAGFRSRDPGPPDSFKQRRLHLTACQNWTHRYLAWVFVTPAALDVRIGQVFAYRVNCVREIVRIAGLAVRNSDGLQLSRKFSLVH
jgi:hypothetical protein